MAKTKPMYALIWWFRSKTNHVILLSKIPKKHRHAKAIFSLHGEEVKVIEISENQADLENRIQVPNTSFHANAQDSGNESETVPTSNDTVNSGNAGISSKFQALLQNANKSQKSKEIGRTQSIFKTIDPNKQCSATITSQESTANTSCFEEADVLPEFRYQSNDRTSSVVNINFTSETTDGSCSQSKQVVTHQPCTNSAANADNFMTSFVHHPANYDTNVISSEKSNHQLSNTDDCYHLLDLSNSRHPEIITSSTNVSSESTFINDVQTIQTSHTRIIENPQPYINHQQEQSTTIPFNETYAATETSQPFCSFGNMNNITTNQPAIIEPSRPPTEELNCVINDEPTSYDEPINATETANITENTAASSSTDTSDNELAGVTNEIVATAVTGPLTLRDVKIKKYTYKAFKHRFQQQQRQPMQELSSNFQLCNDYLIPSSNRVELYPGCGFFLPSKTMAFIELQYDRKKKWEVFIQEIIIQVYGNHRIHFSATGKTGRPGINDKLLKGIIDWAGTKHPDVPRSRIIHQINQVITNRRTYLKNKRLIKQK